MSISSKTYENIVSVGCHGRHRSESYPVYATPAHSVFSVELILLLALLLGVSYPGELRSQTANVQTVTGMVVDPQGTPLIGATVQPKSSNGLGVVTDADGSFTIDLASGDEILVVSYIGYRLREIEVANQSTLTVELEEDYAELDEVLVVGYGTAKKSDLTGSVSSIDVEELNSTPLTSLDQGLQGRAAGVQVTQTSGQPGAVATIRIRGGNSLQGGNEPLYVIDGFPIYNGGGVNTPGAGPAVNGLASINPNDIESIEVLKDASATAIYGSRGANGVVLITTKSGAQGRDEISLETYYGVQQVARRMDLLDATEFAQLVNEAYTNDGLDPVFSDAEISGFGAGTDWQDEVFRSAPIQSYQLTFSGGDQKTSYALSAGYFDQEGVVINSHFERFSGRANVTRHINESLQVGTNLTLTRSSSNTPRTATDGGGSTGVVLGALMMSPIQRIYANSETGEYTLLNDRGINVPNPVASASEITNGLTSTRLLGNLFATYEITSGLTARVSVGADLFGNKGDYYAPSYIYEGTGSGGEALVSSAQSTTWLNENTLTYATDLSDISALNLLAGVTFQGNRNEFVRASSQSFVTDNLQQYSLQSGAVYNQPGSGVTEWGLVSYIGRANYSLRDRYLFTLTGRVDGSSRFGQGNKYGFFPSGSVAWRLIEEDFVQQLELFSDLKLRTSYGVTGNQEIGLYNSLATLASTTYLFNGQLATGFLPNRVPNSDLQWERTAQFDVGLDVGFANNRLRLTADYYRKTTTDLLYSADVPWTSGFSSSLQNIGSIQNQGVEVSLGTDNLVGAFRWSTDFNIAFNRNRVLDLGAVDFFYAGGASGHLKVDQVSRVEVGYPIGRFYGYVSDGIFQSPEEVAGSAQPNAQPGDRRYVDLNNDGEITAGGDRTIIGNALPDFFGGMNNTFGYAGVELNVFLQYSYGNDLLNYNRFELELPTGDQNVSAALLDRWTPTNPSNEYTRATRQRALLFSDRQVEDGTFLRLRTVTLAYTFPQLSGGGRVLSGLRLYLTGQNLVTLTNYSGFDPEVSRYGATNLSIGEDYGVYPLARSVLVGLNLTL